MRFSIFVKRGLSLAGSIEHFSQVFVEIDLFRLEPNRLLHKRDGICGIFQFMKEYQPQIVIRPSVGRIELCSSPILADRFLELLEIFIRMTATEMGTWIAGFEALCSQILLKGGLRGVRVAQDKAKTTVTGSKVGLVLTTERNSSSAAAI